MNLSLVTMYLTFVAYPVRFIFIKQADNDIVIYFFSLNTKMSMTLYQQICPQTRVSSLGAVWLKKMRVELNAVTRVLKAHCSEAQKLKVKIIAHTM